MENFWDFDIWKMKWGMQFFAAFPHLVLYLEFSPCISGEEDQHRIQFQTPCQHVKDQYDL